MNKCTIIRPRQQATSHHHLGAPILHHISILPFTDAPSKGGQVAEGEALIATGFRNSGSILFLLEETKLSSHQAARLHRHRVFFDHFDNALWWEYWHG
jgi:hypothetical protein